MLRFSRLSTGSKKRNSARKLAAAALIPLRRYMAQILKN
ncbi:unnamed protein product [Brassica oleracea]